MFQATQRRLAIWYTTVTAILLLIFATGFYLYVRHTLIERVDDTLNHVVEVVQRSLVLEPIVNKSLNAPYQVNLEASFGEDTPATEDDRIELEWFSPTGVLLWTTLSEPLDLPIHLLNRGETVRPFPDYWLRQVTERLEVDGQVLGYLRVSHPWFEVTKPVRQLSIDLSLGLSLMIGLVAASGWWLSRLAIQPIKESYQYLRQFTADASHELRNPIALIQTNVQVALADPQPDLQAQRQQLEVVERLTRRLGRLVDDLLFLARQDSGMVQIQEQPCYLDELLLNVVEEQTAIAQTRDITLDLELEEAAVSASAPEPFLLQGDADQLVRLFTNLISNGIQYTPAGGEVQVRVKTVNRNGLTSCQVQITDSGTGIPEEALPHLFERFYRVDPTRTRSQLSTHPDTTPSTPMGTGLGLAIAQAIVTNHHGQIRVDSQLHQGTTFTVILPQQPEERHRALG